MSLNADTPTLETRGTKTQRELFIVIEEIINTLGHSGIKLEQQKEDSFNRISQLEAYLKTNLDDFEHYIHHAVPAYTKKEEIEILKSKIETLNEENSKLKQDMYEKEILIKRLKEALNEEKAKQIW